MIVIDASALAKYILKEPKWKDVEEYIYRDDVYSVNLIVAECANAIWKAYHRKLITTEDAKNKLHALKILADRMLNLVNTRKFLDIAFEYSLKRKVPIYDMLYLALASKKEAFLLTSDAYQAKIGQELGIKVIEV